MRRSVFLVPLHQKIIDQDVRDEGECGSHQEGNRNELN
jgi:hypothetical protein